MQKANLDGFVLNCVAITHSRTRFLERKKKKTYTFGTRNKARRKRNTESPGYRREKCRQNKGTVETTRAPKAKNIFNNNHGRLRQYGNTKANTLNRLEETTGRTDERREDQHCRREKEYLVD